MQLDHVKPSLSRESLDWEVTILIVVDYKLYITLIYTYLYIWCCD